MLQSPVKRVTLLLKDDAQSGICHSETEPFRPNNCRSPTSDVLACGVCQKFSYILKRSTKSEGTWVWKSSMFLTRPGIKKNQRPQFWVKSQMWIQHSVNLGRTSTGSDCHGATGWGIVSKRAYHRVPRERLKGKSIGEPHVWIVKHSSKTFGFSRSVALKSTHHKGVQTWKRVSSFHHQNFWVISMRGDQFIRQKLAFGWYHRRFQLEVSRGYHPPILPNDTGWYRYIAYSHILRLQNHTWNKVFCYQTIQTWGTQGLDP